MSAYGGARRRRECRTLGAKLPLTLWLKKQLYITPTILTGDCLPDTLKSFRCYRHRASLLGQTYFPVLQI